MGDSRCPVLLLFHRQLKGTPAHLASTHPAATAALTTTNKETHIIPSRTILTHHQFALSLFHSPAYTSLPRILETL
jgi:hypothetical protein